MKIDNIDKFGNCVYCHRQLVKNMVIGGKVTGILDAEASDSFFKLDNGSILVVPICMPCKENIDLNDHAIHEEIMKEVQNGWELEIHHMREHTEHFKDFTPEKEQELRDIHSKYKIVSHEPNHKIGG